jgi:hypothetical protein
MMWLRAVFTSVESAPYSVRVSLAKELAHVQLKNC